ncbi:MAG: CoA transferase [Candidatus Protistobacter heckmanni]|nr:CoA transferase [Candidatus Protistobacter heckmanni]
MQEEALNAKPAKALSHIRVLDLSRILAGPWCTQNLADMGAEVIKIERPGAGDDTRGWGPPFLKDPQDRETPDSSYFLSANRGKKSVTVDIATPEGQAIIKKLAAECDVVMENYKVGTLARYGLAYEDLAAINPRLVYCSLTGFGQTGPYSHLPGYDFVFQGMGGLMSITGFPESDDSGGPVKVGIAISDILSGMYATVAILGALEHRNVSGRGQHIDLALLDCVVGLNSYQAINYFLSGKVPVPMGNAHSNMAPYEVYRCKEGRIIIAVGNDGQYAALCRVLGVAELGTDPRFNTAAQRLRNREVLVPIVKERLLTKTMSEWVPLLEAANVPCGPIHDMRQVFEDPQVQHRGIKFSLPHGVGVDAPSLANPIRYSGTPITYERSAPMLGEHNGEVLGGLLGMSEDEIAGLKARKVL